MTHPLQHLCWNIGITLRTLTNRAHHTWCMNLKIKSSEITWITECYANSSDPNCEPFQWHQQLIKNYFSSSFVSFPFEYNKLKLISIWIKNKSSTQYTVYRSAVYTRGIPYWRQHLLHTQWQCSFIDWINIYFKTVLASH